MSENRSDDEGELHGFGGIFLLIQLLDAGCAMSVKKAILCVDDEILILVSIIQELKRVFGTQYIYEQATDAESALEVVQELYREEVEVVYIISDWLMPGMKGDVFLDIVHDRYPFIKAVMITGHADQQAIARVKQNPSVLAVFSKPWSPVELIAVLSEPGNQNQDT